MKFISRSTLEQGFSEVSFNLSAFWLAVVLASPGLFAVAPDKYTELLISNIPPAILTFVTGLFFLERSKIKK